MSFRQSRKYPPAPQVQLLLVSPPPESCLTGNWRRPPTDLYSWMSRLEGVKAVPEGVVEVVNCSFWYVLCGRDQYA